MLSPQTTTTPNTIDFIHQLSYDDLPDEVIHHAKRCLLDLTAVAAGGVLTPLAKIISDYVSEEMPGDSPLLFSQQTASRSGAALANGSIIDSFDAHDGYVICKGHAGVGIYPAILAFLGNPLDTKPQSESAQAILTATVIGYELGTRLGMALHRTACDYHTSGAWNAIAAAAIGARALSLSPEQTRHALGIAEYHGPRSQMMRCIDYPTMVKDASGMGAMVGVSAALLAEKGFTGAPALTLESDEVADLFADLGQRWYILEQYVKYYPVCRWAQPAMEAALVLRQKHNITLADIDAVYIYTFHQAKRLGKKVPQTTEEAQYGLAFPFACALLYGNISAEQVVHGFDTPEITQMIDKIHLEEREKYNHAFPETRWADIVVVLKNGERLTTPPTQSRGDRDNPYSDAVINEKAEKLLTTQMTTAEAQAVIQHFWAL